MKFIHAKLNGQMTERKQQRVNSILKQAGVNLSQVDQTEVWDEYSETASKPPSNFSLRTTRLIVLASSFGQSGSLLVRSNGLRRINQCWGRVWSESVIIGLMNQFLAIKNPAERGR